MALIQCPECGNEISDRAKTCIKCGYPIETYLDNQKTEENIEETEKAKYWCRHCYKQNAIGNAYCSFCGESLLPIDYTIKDSDNTEISQSHSAPIITPNINDPRTPAKTQKNNLDRKTVFYGIILIALALLCLFTKVYLGVLFFGFIAYVVFAGPRDLKPRKKKDYQKHCCPRCGGTNFHAFIEDRVIIPEKSKYSTSINLNPLKPFTLLDTKKKVERKELSIQVSKFICDDCGHIFQ